MVASSSQVVQEVAESLAAVAQLVAQALEDVVGQGVEVRLGRGLLLRPVPFCPGCCGALVSTRESGSRRPPRRGPACDGQHGRDRRRRGSRAGFERRRCEWRGRGRQGGAEGSERRGTRRLRTRAGPGRGRARRGEGRRHSRRRPRCGAPIGPRRRSGWGLCGEGHVACRRCRPAALLRARVGARWRNAGRACCSARVGTRHRLGLRRRGTGTSMACLGSFDAGGSAGRTRATDRGAPSRAAVRGRARSATRRAGIGSTRPRRRRRRTRRLFEPARDEACGSTVGAAPTVVTPRPSTADSGGPGASPRLALAPRRREVARMQRCPLTGTSP